MSSHCLSTHLLKDVRSFAAGGGHSLLLAEVTTFLSHRGAYSRLEADTVAATRIYESEVPAKPGTDSYTRTHPNEESIINLVTIPLRTYGILPPEAAIVYCGRRPQHS